MNNHVTLFELVHRYGIDADYDEPYHDTFNGYPIMICLCSEEVWVGEHVSTFDRWAVSRLCLLDTTKADHVTALAAWLGDGNIEHIEGLWI